jgi:RNA polymerase sigma factor (sigma-70 family)
MGKRRMSDDQELVRRYVGSGSEAAFGELVARHLNLVYSAALRRTNGDTEIAKDATQMVFVDLARKARRLPKNVVVAGWLYRATRFATERLVRAERRRCARERQAIAMKLFEPESAPDWNQIRPLLDAALDRLSPLDRDALVLRYFEQRTLAEVGKTLGASEEATRKRVARALEKVRTILSRRGVTTGTSALASAILDNAVQVAPAGLAASLASGSLAPAVAGTGAALTFLKSIVMTKLQASIIGGLAVISVAAPWAVHDQSQASLRAKEELLRKQAGQLSVLAAENERLSKALAREQRAPVLARESADELLRLRGEVGVLREQKREWDRMKGELAAERAAQTNTAGEHAQPQPIPRASWAFAGYATPEASLESIVWAMSRGDTETFLASMTPQGRRFMEQHVSGKTANEITQELTHEVSSIEELALDSKKVANDGTVSFTIAPQDSYRGSQRLHQETVLSFQNIEGQWKLSLGDAASSGPGQ